jgi:Chaperonin GroEL (HSP60 family)
MSQQSIPGVVFQPQTREGLQRGIAQLVALVRPTLGPIPRLVAVENTFRDRTPEVLEDAGVIARRVIQLKDRQADVGAMLLRDVLWRVQKQVGDGTATAAILFASLYEQGVRYIAAGGNAMQLRKALERGIETILKALDAQTQAIQGQKNLTRLAESLCFDAGLAPMLGEIFDTVGHYGFIELRNSNSRQTSHRYVAGSYWPSKTLSPYFYTNPGALRYDLYDAAILLSDLDFNDPREMTSVVQSVLQSEHKALLIVANSLSESVLGLLVAAGRATPLKVVAVQAPEAGVARIAALQDLAALTGARPLLKDAGDSLRGWKLSDLGGARHIWSDNRRLGIVSGQGDPRRLRQHIRSLQAAYEAAESDKKEPIRNRIGRLLGCSAAILIGGDTESEINLLEERLKKSCALMRLALHDGVLPGGGIALLNCQEALNDLYTTSDQDEQRAAYSMLMRALEEPFNTIVSNAGYEPAAIRSELNNAPAGFGFDALTGQVVDMTAAGIYEITQVLKQAVRIGFSGAATALTIDTVVHKRKPEVAIARS